MRLREYNVGNTLVAGEVADICTEEAFEYGSEPDNTLVVVKVGNAYRSVAGAKTVRVGNQTVVVLLTEK